MISIYALHYFEFIHLAPCFLHSPHSLAHLTHRIAITTHYASHPALPAATCSFSSLNTFLACFSSREILDSPACRLTLLLLSRRHILESVCARTSFYTSTYRKIRIAYVYAYGVSLHFISHRIARHPAHFPAFRAWMLHVLIQLAYSSTGKIYCCNIARGPKRHPSAVNS